MNQRALKVVTAMPDLYNRLLESLNTAIVLADEHCQIEYLNQAAESVLGISVAKAEGQDISRILADNEFERKTLLACIRDRNPLVKRQSDIYDERGRKVIIDFSLTPVDFGNEAKFVFEIQEINRLVKISREESIMASHDTTRQLVRGLAHEVKNPLGGIRGAAQLLHAELDDPELKEYTQIITDEVDRLRSLVDGMLGPNRPMTMEPLNIHEVLDPVLKLISAECSSHINIARDYDPSLPDITGDKDHLVQALLNITRNAVQAMQESNTPEPTLTVLTRVQRRFTIGTEHHVLVARIDIQDNGPGIAPERIDEIFYPMITSRSEGTGLGLPIAQSIVSSHKGLIECSSESGKTVFSIVIPIPASL